MLADNLSVFNSKARNDKEFDDQKVVFKYKGINLAELEMRNDSNVHYREIRFNMYKPRAVNLLLEKVLDKIEYNEKVILYGAAIKKFHKNKRESIH